MHSIITMKKQAAILIEDTEIMNSSYSILLDSVLDSKASNTLLLFWRSPCYELDNLGMPILSLTPTYLSGYKKPKHTLFSSYLYKRLPSTLSPTEIYKKLFSQFHRNQPIPLSYLNTVTYKDVNLGRPISSLAIRALPNVAISREAPVEFVLFYLARLYQSVDLIQVITNVFDVKAAFFSENVYLSAALIDRLLQCNVPMLNLLRAEGPLEILPTDLTLNNYHSPCAWANIRALIQDSTFSESMPESTLFTSSSVTLTAARHSSTTVDTLVTSICASRHVNFLADIQELKNLIGPSQPVINLYLHATTDGAYFFGDSGFPLPVDFFVKVVQLFKAAHSSSEFTTSPVFIIRPHPNIFHSLYSHYQSYHHKALVEKHVFTAHLIDLINTLKKTCFRFGISSTEIPVEELLALQSSVHVSHHGTVLHDAYAHSKPIICSRVSFLDTLQDQNHIFYVETTSTSQQLATFFANKTLFSYTPGVIDQAERINQSRRLNPYTTSYRFNFLSPLQIQPFSSSISCLDKYLYLESLSWQSKTAFKTVPELQRLINYASDLCKPILNKHLDPAIH